MERYNRRVIAKIAAESDIRFEFGKNWKNFLALIDEQRISHAEESIRQALNVRDLKGKTFLDIGCGSGLFSLAAVRLGARVHSFDFDRFSVESTQALKTKYGSASFPWVVEQGSVLDASYLDSLGTFDVVYSWGVLHHTGDMWKALEHAAQSVKPGGQLFIAIYNDQSRASRRWKAIKRFYSRSARPTQALMLLTGLIYFQTRFMAAQLLRARNPFRFLEASSADKKKRLRGMSAWHDLVDWIGGYPFEVAKPEEIFSFFKKKGFELTFHIASGGSGCNEFVFHLRDRT